MIESGQPGTNKRPSTTCVYVCVCVGECSHVCTAQSSSWGVIPQSCPLILFSFGTRLSLGLNSLLGDSSHWFPSLSPPLLFWNYKHAPPCPVFLCRFLKSDLGSHSCTATTLLTKWSLQYGTVILDKKQDDTVVKRVSVTWNRLKF